ncbi:hypothetical protein RB595_000055 [Gaeumannomyces hyphopodioides]
MAPGYTVGQLFAMNDPALVQYMVNNRDARQLLDITNITDWDATPEAQQTELLERLIRLGPQAKAPQFIDSDQLVSKLNAISRPGVETPLRETEPSSPQLARPVSLSPQPSAGKVHQIQCYHALINNGGRPPCSLEVLDEIYERPAEYIEVLKPWLGDPTSSLSPDDLGVFSRPLERWKEFRRWQSDNRGVGMTDDEDLADFRDERRRYFESAGLGQMTTAPDYNKTIEEMWQKERRNRRWERDNFREVRGGSFDEYVEAARRRLREYGFSEDFQPLEDPAQQGERVTWIEYLEFEYWWLDRRARSVQRYQQRRDAIWKELLRSGVLRDGETEEDLLGPEVQSPQIEPPPLGGERHRRGSQSALRNDLINRFIQNREAHRSAEAYKSSQLLLVEWARGQMPGMPERKLEAHTRKRSRQCDNFAEEPTEQPTAKKQKQQKEDKESAARRKASLRTKRMAAELECPVQNTRVPNKNGLRRSARIRGLRTGTHNGQVLR